MEWLSRLEARVKEASRALAELRRQNAKLKAKVRRLESAASNSSPSDPAEKRRRDEARRRVERLGQRLREDLDG